MKVVLKDDWDIPIHPPVEGADPKGHFVGRDKELSFLSNELSRRDSGVSGCRAASRGRVRHLMRLRCAGLLPLPVRTSGERTKERGSSESL